ncbi:MAG: M14 family metallopeptidase [Bacteroidota bacterium]
MKKILVFSYLFLANFAIGQKPLTIFEQSKGKESATYTQSIAYYQQLALKYKTIQIKTMGPTDAGFPLHIVLFSSDQQFNSADWKKKNKLVILVTNGIHPGEPDGIDASMMLLRDLASGKLKAPSNIVLAVMPVYNIGGALNRNSSSRVNQDGPTAYGFRGNSQNLDLNRDFIKSDTKEAVSFAKIFHWLNPDIYLDNHVSDGADYQYTMTLLTTQHNKLGGEIGKYLHTIFEPSLFKEMAQKGMAMTPYVSFEEGNPEKGWSYFYDPPRYSSGYAAVFQTMSFMSETHMLKPFQQRVIQTYELMQTMIAQASLQASAIKEAKQLSIEAIKNQNDFVVSYKVDTSHFDLIDFMGYQAFKKPSAVTGMERLYYDRSKPFTQKVKFYNYALADKMVHKPKAYLIPQGWQKVIELLEANAVQMKQIEKDSLMTVEAYHIDDYKTSSRVFEKHYRHSDLKTSTQTVSIFCRKGDYLITTGQAADRFLIETLEPISDDSYFSWNFFDAILQQKEGYSNYRWEDVAASFLASHPELQLQLEEKKKADPKFATSANAQLDFIYKNSPYYEPAHLRYPIFRLR